MTHSCLFDAIKYTQDEEVRMQELWFQNNNLRLNDFSLFLSESLS